MNLAKPTQLALGAPSLSLHERDRRWRGLQNLMKTRGFDAILVGSFQGRERLESYLIDDFLDSVVILPAEGSPTVLAFSTNRVSRIHESERRGIEPWVHDIRIGHGGRAVGEILREKRLEREHIGIVGFGPTAPGEMEGLLPLGFWQNLESALPEAKFGDFTRDFTDFVLIKSDEEISLLRYAAEVSEDACRTMLDTARPGVSEAELYAEVARTVFRYGCDLRYPFMSLQSGPDNIAWGQPRWLLRAEAPRTLRVGDLVQAEIHTCYGGQEAQVQMSVALDPVDPEIRKCESAARRAYEAALGVIKEGVMFEEVVQAMEKPLKDEGVWAKTPLLHTLTFGATGFTAANREQLRGTSEEWLEIKNVPGVRRPNLVLQSGMGLELEPNACIMTKRVNIGGSVIVSGSGCEELNMLPTMVQHVC